MTDKLGKYLNELPNTDLWVLYTESDELERSFTFRQSSKLKSLSETYLNGSLVSCYQIGRKVYKILAERGMPHTFMD